MATREGDQRARIGPRTWIHRSILEMRRISELKAFCADGPGKVRKAISLVTAPLASADRCRGSRVLWRGGSATGGEQEDLFATRRAVRKPVTGAVGARFRMARYARESPTGWEAAVLACVNTGRVVD